MNTLATLFWTVVAYALLFCMGLVLSEVVSHISYETRFWIMAIWLCISSKGKW